MGYELRGTSRVLVDAVTAALVVWVVVAIPVAWRLVGPGGPVSWLLALVAGVATLQWRRRPLPFVVAAATVGTLAGAFPVVAFALYRYAEHTASWRPVALTGSLTLASIAAPIWHFGGPDAAVPLGLAICAPPALLGLYVGSNLQRLRDDVRRAERHQLERVARARSDERAQIARDMHDVVTHRVAQIVLHATALEASGGREATETAARIGAIGREALDELRSLVAVLRPDDEALLRPQPGLNDLPDLADDARLLGTPVSLRMDDVTPAVPAFVGYALYRTVQEALTNIHKHAAGADTEITLTRDADTLRLTVTNGRGNGGDGGLPDGGHGLLGAAERIRLVGGTFGAGPTSTGGFGVVATVTLGGRVDG